MGRHPANDRRKSSLPSFLLSVPALRLTHWPTPQPNFLHAGDHVHLGPGVTSVRRHDPGVDLHDLPAIDVVLLSHYHEDHFDRQVEDSLRRDLPIISTPHAKACLTTAKQSGGDDFRAVYDLDFWESMMVDVKPAGEGRKPRIKVTGMPGKHVPDGVLGTVNEFLKAVPPTNGWMVELGYGSNDDGDFECGYRYVCPRDIMGLGGFFVRLIVVSVIGSTYPETR